MASRDVWLTFNLVFDCSLRAKELGGIQELLLRVNPLWMARMEMEGWRGARIAINPKQPDSMYKALFAKSREPNPFAHLSAESPPEYATGAAFHGANRSLDHFEIAVHQDRVQFQTDNSFKWANTVNMAIGTVRVLGKPRHAWASETIKEFGAAIPPVYARVADLAEIAAKNVVSGKEGTRAVGMDISKYLPGLYWLNYFGPPYCDLIGKDRLLSAPAWSVEQAGKGILIRLSDDPVEWSSREYVERERRVREHLGPQFFFWKNAPVGRHTVGIDVSKYPPASGHLVWPPPPDDLSQIRRITLEAEDVGLPSVRKASKNRRSGRNAGPDSQTP